MPKSHSPSKNNLSHSTQSGSLLNKYAKEIKLVCYVIGIYAVFIYWGYLQEKITTTSYKNESSMTESKWIYPYALNFCMASTACLFASVFESFRKPSSSEISQKPPATVVAFWKAGMYKYSF